MKTSNQSLKIYLPGKTCETFIFLFLLNNVFVFASKSNKKKTIFIL